MMRQTQSSLRLLLRMQATRERRDADSRTCEQAACAEHRTLSMMTAALTKAPAAAPQPELPSRLPDPPPPPPEPPEPELIDPPLTAAEHYVVLYPERAALIRRCRGVPETVSFGPPDPELVQELLAAAGPFFEALDVVYADAKAVSPTDPSSRMQGNETSVRLAAA
ncbi:MAG TPA: hypothetical protein VFW75_06435 [Acetobacteraceae bacterium]|nr:hypothetical protein [Acetobacteraceae bacterium]